MSSIPLGTKGFVYCLATDSHGYTKIGATTLHPEVRAFQLTCATASPHPFRVIHFREVPDCNAAEAALHARFAGRRINESREFFSVSPDEAALALDDICGDRQYVPAGLDEYPWARLFATFPDDGDGRSLTTEEQAACRRLETKTA